MVKVTHIFKTYFPETSGGLEEAIRQCGRHAVDNGFDVEVVSVGSKAYTLTSADGIQARFFNKTIDLFSNPFSFSLARSFRRICENTDILHFHFPWPTAELLVLFWGIKKPALVTFHCDIHKARLLKTLYLPFIRQYLKKMDRICITNRGLLATTAYLAPFRDKIQEIPLFLNENRFLTMDGPDAETIAFTAKVSNYALFTGVLRWYKGLDVLLNAAKIVDHDIVIVGKGPFYGALAARIEKENLTNVHLMGFQKDNNLKWLIQQSRFIVLPSITPAEAFGQILLEGLYFSKPLVSTELGTGTSRVNRHNHTGFVVPPGCAASLAGAMNRMFQDDALCQRFSANAFQHYLANYTAAVQGEKYLSLYNSFFGSDRRNSPRNKEKT